MPDRSKSPRSSRSGSMERKRTAAGADRRSSIRGSPYRLSSTLTPHQIWRCFSAKHYALEPGTKPGSFRVHLDTERPSFETFLAEIDGGEKKSVASGFTWT